MKIKKIVSTSLALVMVLLSVSGCSGSSNEGGASTEATTAGEATEAKVSEVPSGEVTTITFSLWDENQAPVYEEIAKVFESENPDIDVEIQLTPWAQYWTKLDAALTGGQAADVIWMNTYLPKYAEAGVIEPLTDYIAAAGIDMSGYADACVSLSSNEGVVYGMPKGMDVIPVFINTAIFEKYEVELPSEDWDWAELVTKGAELRDAIAAGSGTEYAVAMELSPQSTIQNFTYQDGVEPWDNSTTPPAPAYANPDAQKGYNDMLSLWEAEIMASYTILSDTPGSELFASEKAGIYFGGTWLISQFDKLSFAQDIVLYQQPKRGDNNSSMLSGLSFTMNAATENKDAAWRFIEFLGGETSNQMQAEAGIDIPALVAEQEHYSTQNIDVSIVSDIAAKAFFAGYNDVSALVYPIITEYSGRIFSGEFSPEEGLQRLTEEINSLW